MRSLSDSKYKFVAKSQNLSVRREMCEPQNREINVSRKFHAITFMIAYRTGGLTGSERDAIQTKDY